MDFEAPNLPQAEIDRRRYRRVKLVAQVLCEALERNEVVATRDVSSGGMFLDVKFPLPLASELTITFRLRPKDPPLTCRALVKFSRVDVGMGIEFVDLGEEARQLIERFVEEAP